MLLVLDEFHAAIAEIRVPPDQQSLGSVTAFCDLPPIPMDLAAKIGRAKDRVAEAKKVGSPHLGYLNDVLVLLCHKTLA